MSSSTFDSSNLRGLWAAVPTPFVAGGPIDFDALRENVNRLTATGVDGIYTTDSDGEFYALELAEYQQLAQKFGAAVREAGVPAQMGATWVNTAGVIDRMKAGMDVGIDTFHVALPFFMPLPMRDVYRFFEALAAAVPDARWIYYAHPSCLPLLKGKELARLAELFPTQLIGTKLNAYEMHDLTDVVVNCPQLANFVGERNLLFGRRLGAVGCYSYWVNSMPVWTRRFYDTCGDGDQTAAVAMHLKLHRWETEHVAAIRQAGYRHGVLGKARGPLTHFLQDDGSTRAPYHPATEQEIADLQDKFGSYWRDDLGAEPKRNG